MFPHIQIFLKQTQRGTKRLALQLVLLCAVTAFFVVSLNLYSNSMRNLQTVEDTYTTIATAEFRGFTDERGNLVQPADESCVGYRWMSVNQYDLSPLEKLDSVKKVHLRTRVGAYIPGHIPVLHIAEGYKHVPDGALELFGTEDVIRFTLDAEEPLVISLADPQDPVITTSRYTYVSFPIRILEQGNPLLVYSDELMLRLQSPKVQWFEPFAEELRRLNRSDRADCIILYPGVEYVMTCTSGDYWQKDEETGKYVWLYQDRRQEGHLSPLSCSALSIFGFNYYDEFFLNHTDFGVFFSWNSTGRAPFSIFRYEDVKDDPEWAAYTQSGIYSVGSFAVTLTDDIELIPAWYEDVMFLNEGRMITEEEYQSGAKVCMVSAKQAELQGWQIGDTLDMHLYSFNYYTDEAILTAPDFVRPSGYLSPPTYLKDCGGFFAEDTYEIVGIYGQKEFADFGETAEEVFYNPWNAIYIPANAAPNAPEGPIQPSLLTIHLKNGSINEFKAAVEKMGLTDQVPGEYEIKFSYLDQGYGKIKDSLIELNRNAKLLLGLSSVLLLVTMILMSFLFAQQHKHSAGILRMLGGSKKQAFVAILTCAAVVVAAGGIVGTVLGGALTQSVGASILGDTAASATVELATGASPVLTALSGVGCMALFLLLTAIFTSTYMGKEPRALLPKDQA